MITVREIKKGVYEIKKIETEVVDLNKLMARLKEIDKELEELHKSMVKYRGRSKDVTLAVDMYNESEYGPMIADLESERSMIIDKIEFIKRHK